PQLDDLAHAGVELEEWIAPKGIKSQFMASISSQTGPDHASFALALVFGQIGGVTIVNHDGLIAASRADAQGIVAKDRVIGTSRTEDHDGRNADTIRKIGNCADGDVIEL